MIHILLVEIFILIIIYYNVLEGSQLGITSYELTWISPRVTENMRQKRNKRVYLSGRILPSVQKPRCYKSQITINKRTCSLIFVITFVVRKQNRNIKEQFLMSLTRKSIQIRIKERRFVLEKKIPFHVRNINVEL